MVQHPLVHAAQPWRGGRGIQRGTFRTYLGVGAAEAAVQRPLLVADHEPMEQDRHRLLGTWPVRRGPFHAGRAGQGNNWACGNDVAVCRAGRLRNGEGLGPVRLMPQTTAILPGGIP